MRLAVVAAVACSVVGLSFAQESQAISRKYTNIPAQGLGPALQFLAKDRNFQVVYVSEEVNGVQTTGAVGDLTLDEALTNLLAGTGLHFKYLDERTMVVGLDVNDDKLPLPIAGANSSPRRGEEEALREGKGKGTSGPLELTRAEGDENKLTEVEEQKPSIAGAESKETLEEIMVTGTHIRGSQPAGAKVLVIDREYIEKSGYGRIEDVLATLPQTFGGNTEGNQSITSQNFSRGSEIQLRGLGPGTTLVLVNGHRQAGGGLQGGFVDVSSIPTVAIERIDVLPDGASAIYGSDAIGGVINIILRSDFTGAETLGRLGTARGGAEEKQISQILGTSWTGGNALFGYQYLQRDDLAGTDRDAFAANGDFTARGGGDFRRIGGVPGTIYDPFTGEPAFAIPAGQDGTQLASDQLVPGSNYTDIAGTTWILPRQELNAAFFTGTQQLSESVRLLADARFGKREFRQLTGGDSRFLFVPASNPFYVNPIEPDIGLVVVQYDLSRDLGIPEAAGTAETYAATLGTDVQLARDWELSVSGSYANERNRLTLFNQVSDVALDQALADGDPATAFNPFGDGGNNNPATLALIRRTLASQGESTVKTADAILNGEAFSLPGGSTRLALGASYRDDRLTAVSENGASDDLARQSTAAYVELAIPLAKANESRHGMTKFELSLAGRYEDYSDFGNTFDPKYGINWWPFASVKVRGTWSTAFRAPAFAKLSEILTPSQSALLPDTPDPGSPTGTSNILVVVGGNPDLQEETATVWTAGIDIDVPQIEGLAVSTTYFDIDYRDKVSSPDSLASVLFNQDQYAALLTRNPSQAQIDEICSRPDFLNDPQACELPIGLIIDGREKNIAVSAQRGVDFLADYAFDLFRSEWRFGLNATYIIDNDIAITAASPVTDIADTVGAPLELRLRGGISWQYIGWNADAILNYQGSYTDSVSPTPRRVGSWMTTDLGLGYDFGERNGWLSDFRIAINAINVFDEDPPFVNHIYGYDLANGKLLGRFISAQVTKTWGQD